MVQLVEKAELSGVDRVVVAWNLVGSLLHRHQGSLLWLHCPWRYLHILN